MSDFQRFFAKQKKIMHEADIEFEAMRGKELQTPADWERYATLRDEVTGRSMRRRILEWKAQRV